MRRLSCRSFGRLGATQARHGADDAGSLQRAATAGHCTVCRYIDASAGLDRLLHDGIASSAIGILLQITTSERRPTASNSASPSAAQYRIARHTPADLLAR